MIHARREKGSSRIPEAKSANPNSATLKSLSPDTSPAWSISSISSSVRETGSCERMNRSSSASADIPLHLSIWMFLHLTLLSYSYLSVRFPRRQTLGRPTRLCTLLLPILYWVNPSPDCLLVRDNCGAELSWLVLFVCWIVPGKAATDFFDLVLRILLPHLLVHEDAELVPLHRPATVDIHLSDFSNNIVISYSTSCILPRRLLYTSLIASCSSASVGFWPRDRITLFSSCQSGSHVRVLCCCLTTLVLMLPSPFWSYWLKASRKIRFSSSDMLARINLLSSVEIALTFIADQ